MLKSGGSRACPHARELYWLDFRSGNPFHTEQQLENISGDAALLHDLRVLRAKLCLSRLASFSKPGARDRRSPLTTESPSMRNHPLSFSPSWTRKSCRSGDRRLLELLTKGLISSCSGSGRPGAAAGAAAGVVGVAVAGSGGLGLGRLLGRALVERMRKSSQQPWQGRW